MDVAPGTGGRTWAASGVLTPRWGSDPFCGIQGPRASRSPLATFSARPRRVCKARLGYLLRAPSARVQSPPWPPSPRALGACAKPALATFSARPRRVCKARPGYLLRAPSARVQSPPWLPSPRALGACAKPALATFSTRPRRVCKARPGYLLRAPSARVQSLAPGYLLRAPSARVQSEVRHYTGSQATRIERVALAHVSGFITLSEPA